MKNFIDIKRTAIQTQLDALRAGGGYRITLKPRREGLPPCNFGNRMNKKQRKAAGRDERFYLIDDLTSESVIRRLTAANMAGYDIYVTPISNSHHYIVIDDIAPAALVEMLADGYAPALTQKSSSKNMQAVIIVSKIAARDEQSIANVLVKRLNRYGDPLLTGVVHPFRLSGFVNKKDDRNGKPTVVLTADFRICSKADSELTALRDLAQPSVVLPSRGGAAPVVCALVCQSDSPEAIAFTTYFTRNLATAKERYAKPDYDRIDWQCARSMAAIGYSADQITAALLSASPHVRERHKHVLRYAAITADRAIT